MILKMVYNFKKKNTIWRNEARRYEKTIGYI